MGEIIKGANFWWTIVMLYTIYRVVSWEYAGHLSDSNRRATHYLLLVFVAAGVNHGWFAMSRHLAPNGHTWFPWMLEWRWLMVLITSTMFAWGCAGFVRLIDGDSMSKQYLVFFLSGVIAFVAGFY